MKAADFFWGPGGFNGGPLHRAIRALCLMGLVVSGCTGDQHPAASVVGPQDAAFRAIGANPARPFYANHAAVLEGDTIFLIRFDVGTAIPQNQGLVLGLEREGALADTTVVYHHLRWEAFNAGDMTSYAFLRVPLPVGGFRAIDIRMPVLDGKGKADTLALGATRFHLEALGVQRCDGPVSRGYQNLNQWVFREQLTHGIFFEVQREIYLLFHGTTCWVIRRKPGDGSTRFMLHFIDQDSGFDNYSFPMGPSAFEGCLEDPRGLWVTRVNLARPFDSYRKIRVGQFTGEGNIWVQTMQVSRILENQLLRYTDPLE